MKYLKYAAFVIGGVVLGEVHMFRSITKNEAVRKAIVGELAKRATAIMHSEVPTDETIVFENREAAEKVLESLTVMQNNYGYVSVADLNDLSGTVGNYKDARRGWKNIDSARVKRVKYGYIVDLPTASAL